MQNAEQTAVILKVKEHVLNLYNLLHKTALLYHNYQRVEKLMDLGHAFCDHQNLPKQEKELVLLTLAFADAGYLTDYDAPTDHSIKEAFTFLKEINYPPEYSEQVIDSLDRLIPKGHPKTKLDYIVADCLTACSKDEAFSSSIQLLRLEHELLTGQHRSNLQWNQLLLQDLLQTRYFTAYGKTRYEPLLATHIVSTKNLLEKGNRDLQKKSINHTRFNQLEAKVPERGIQSFFRSNFRNHIHLSAIADNKANIMISINAILISVLITSLTYQNITQTKPGILLPVVLFLLTGLTSLIFAVLSIRPKVTSVISADMPDEQLRKDIAFFGNFVQLDLEKYEQLMDGLLRNGENLYQTMTRDLYALGKVLDKKYRFLTYSYNIFMVGFVATVISFLLILFL